MNITRFTLKMRPKAQKRRRTTHSHTYDPSAKDKKNFLKDVKHYSPETPIDKPFIMDYRFFFRIPKQYHSAKDDQVLTPTGKEMLYQPYTGRPDLSNVIKFIEDALEYSENDKGFGNGGFYTDDKLCYRGSQEKLYGIRDRVEVTITW